MTITAPNRQEERQHRLNREITSKEVRLIGLNKEPLGVVSLIEALNLAGDADVDLVEIAATATPPVCQLIEYGKFKYIKQKKEAEVKQKPIEIKEVKFRPGTDEADFNVKLRNIRRFLDEGNKCKITLRFKGRELSHQDIGLALLTRIKTELSDAVIELNPKLDGKQLTMVLAPPKKKS